MHRLTLRAVALPAAGALLVSAAAWLAPPPAGAKSPAPSSATDERILDVYTTTGSVPPCRFSVAQLSHALRTVDTYGSVYFADEPNAIDQALEARSGGACRPQHQTGTHGTSPASSGGPDGSSLGFAPPAVTGATGASLPAPILILALLTAAAALVGGAVLAGRWSGWDPPGAAAVRHSFGEAGYRIGGLWGDFTDWLRSGSDRRRV